MAVENGGEAGSWGRPYVTFQRMYRRKRKYVGDEIDNAFNSLAHRAQLSDRMGVLCKECGKRRAYKDIYFKYSTTSDGHLWRSWFCGACDNMIKEDELG